MAPTMSVVDHSCPETTKQTIISDLPATGFAQNVSIIDLSEALKTNPDESVLSETVAAIGRACEEWGFFQVTNHGVPMETYERVKSVARRFFALPIDEKKKVKRMFTNPQGFDKFDHTMSDNVKDRKEIFDYTVEEQVVVPLWPNPDNVELRVLRNQWPQNPSDLRDVCKEYAEEMVKLAYKLTELICMSLNLPKDRLKDCFNDQTSFIRLSYYPPPPSTNSNSNFTSKSTLGVSPHIDYSAITILAQEGTVAGLEVLQKSTGEWKLVLPQPNALVVQVGDVLRVWSNDKFKTVLHRVRMNPEEKRRSFPFFFNPSHDVDVEPLDELLSVTDDGHEHKKEMKAKGYNYGMFYAHKRFTHFNKIGHFSADQSVVM